MSKKKHGEMKTLVEKMLDKAAISYVPYTFPTHTEGDVQQLDAAGADVDPHLVYKTIVFTGNKTGPVVGVVPLDRRVSLKKIAKASGNKKVELIPLKDLEKTTGYEHGANTPIGIHETHKYPIYVDAVAEQEPQIIVSAGKIGRSVGIAPDDLIQFVAGHFADIGEADE
ncbi:Protein ebsC [Schleiferilactobacillus shenzhenensis LY-73]|uniref:Cys-tRNA(Pro)/Cys-tRNA(Cys) deacylase n=2 Tax=Schleiferilactobacillus shenzhenensis TaxID=1231337 RepID=U4TZN2_9LACO|nr:Protein ebsC [Schleiferilactobacillus shenzhenensis LY-73]